MSKNKDKTVKIDIGILAGGINNEYERRKVEEIERVADDACNDVDHLLCDGDDSRSVCFGDSPSDQKRKGCGVGAGGDGGISADGNGAAES